MYKVEVDDADVHKLTRAAEAFFRHLPRKVLLAVARAAERERSSHAYQNRTGKLEHTTRGTSVETGGGDFEAELTMEQEYASYVNGRGFSNIDSAAEQADADIRAEIDRAERKLESM